MHSDVSQKINYFLEPLKDNFNDINLVPKNIKNNVLFMRQAFEIYRQPFSENTQAKDMCMRLMYVLKSIKIFIFIILTYIIR